MKEPKSDLGEGGCHRDRRLCRHADFDRAARRLATVPTPVRFSAFAAGFVIYLLVRRSVLAGVIGAELVLPGGKWLLT